MEFLAHRGLWQRRSEHNTVKSLSSACSAGYGLEFDVRDLAGHLVVAHDPPSEGTELGVLLEELSTVAVGPLAVNVKSTRLHRLLLDAFSPYDHLDWFVFDHAIPDLREAVALGLPCFTRQSDLEPTPVLYEDAVGVWVDAFETDWVAEADVVEHLEAGKSVALVSPELHGRPHVPIWEEWRSWAVTTGDRRVMLCTDHPGDAARFWASQGV